MLWYQVVPETCIELQMQVSGTSVWYQIPERLSVQLSPL